MVPALVLCLLAGLIGPAAGEDVTSVATEAGKGASAPQPEVNTPPSEAVKPTVPEPKREVKRVEVQSGGLGEPRERSEGSVRSEAGAGSVRPTEEKRESKPREETGGKTAGGLKERLRQPDTAERSTVDAQLLVGALIAALVGLYSIGKNGRRGASKIPAA
ncbi:MAG: hypothetical protein ABGY09_05065 [Euryarchaeota archaeon]